MKKNKAFIIGFIAPCALSLLVMYLYPVVRTVIMSFFGIESVTAEVSDWSFNGIDNYIKIFSPDENQKLDAWLFQFRLYHDAFVYENKVKGIYLSSRAGE